MDLGVKVGAALAAAHGERGQRVFEYLLKAEELDNGEVDRRMEAKPALVGAYGGVVLHAVAAVDLHLAAACSYRLTLAFDFDSKQLAQVISAIAECGAKPELSIAFTVKNPATVSEELLISATENARAKAEILCKASGSTLGQLLNIDYNWGELNVLSRTSYEVEDCIQPLMAMSKCSAPEIEPDDIDVSDTVAFTWEIA